MNRRQAIKASFGLLLLPVLGYTVPERKLTGKITFESGHELHKTYGIIHALYVPMLKITT